MLIPKKLKHRKHFRGKMPGEDTRGSSITLPAGLTNLPGYTTYLWQYDSVANVNTAAPTFIPTADTTLVAKWS